MTQDEFLEAVERLREEGRTIQVIASELGAHGSRIVEALKTLGRLPLDGVGYTVNSPSSSAHWYQPPFVGRSRELSELQFALGRAIGGEGQLVMLAGEPGIGKTRTAQELAAYAEMHGAQVLWGWCYEEEGAPPYWPWVQPLQSHIRQRDPEQLRMAMGSGAAEIAKIIPDIREMLPEINPPPHLEPEQARFQLFESVASFLKNEAELQPLVILLDDLHWADRSSLLLLEFLAHQIVGSRMLLIGTFRDREITQRHPLYHVLGTLVRLPIYRRVLLGGLSTQEVKDLVEVTAGLTLVPGLIETIHQRTEGNPFFVAELARLLEQEGVEDERSLVALLPEGVRVAIGRRLNRVSEACNQVLTTASVIGKEFDFKQLQILNGNVAEELLLQLVEEALVVHLIEEVPGGQEHYQFSHALIQDTLLAGLSASRRVRLHARIGGALEELYGSQAEAHAAELAYHFGQAESVIGPEKLVRYGQLAGQQALAANAYEEAFKHFEEVLAAKRGQPMDDDMAELILGQGLAQMAAFGRSHYLEALKNLAIAFDYYVEVGQRDRAIAIAAHPFEFWTEQHPGVAKLIEQGLKLVPPDSHPAGRLLSSYGRIQGIDNSDYQGAQVTFTQALAIASKYQDVALEMRTLACGAMVGFFHLKLRESLSQSQRANSLASIANDPPIEALAGFWASLVMAMVGDLDEADLMAKRSLALAEKVRSSQTISATLLANSLIAQLGGDWDAARSFSDRGLALWPMDPRFLAARMLMECQIGNVTQVKAYINSLLQIIRTSASGPHTEQATPTLAIAIVCRISGISDGLTAAGLAAEAVTSSPKATPFMALMARAGLALLAIQRSDTKEAMQHYTMLQTLVGSLMLFGFSGDCLLGLLSVVIGKLDEATTHFEASLDYCRQGGYRPALGWACCEYADTLLQRNLPGDRSKAITLLEESQAISRELGMYPLTERVVALMNRAETLPPVLTNYPDGLTEREVEVLRLIAQGLNNRQIAQKLVITEGTVRRHVSNIYLKVNVVNRSQATRYALNAGLLASDEVPP